jgi:predicted transcriptional regulator
MVRTSLSLPDELAFVLQREARRRDTSVSAVVRDALAERFGAPSGAPREVAFAAIGRSGRKKGSAKEADRALSEVYEERADRRRDERRRR